MATRTDCRRRVAADRDPNLVGTPEAAMTPTEEIRAALAEMRGRGEKATKGPWEIKEDSANGQDEYLGRWHCVGPIEMLGEKAGDDSKFIAHARQDIPALLDVVEGLAGALERMHDQGPIERFGANTPNRMMEWVHEARAEAREALRAAAERLRDGK